MGGECVCVWGGGGGGGKWSQALQPAWTARAAGRKMSGGGRMAADQ